MSYLEAIWLGIVQGLTEFLPISSSGHLALMQHFLGVKEAGVFFEVMLHVGTLGAVFLVYRNDLLRLTRASVRAIFDRRTLQNPRQAFRESADLRLVLFLFLGSVPTALIGILGKDALESLFDRPVIVACMLIVTGVCLLLPKLFGVDASKGGPVKGWQAPLIGVVQGLAIIPGISRSGSTISTALLLGIESAAAARFSFLLSIPAILGAVVLKLGDLGGEVTLSGAIWAGMLASFIVGYLALLLLLRMLRKGRFAVFSYYCFGLAAVALTLLLR